MVEIMAVVIVIVVMVVCLWSRSCHHDGRGHGRVVMMAVVKVLYGRGQGHVVMVVEVVMVSS